MFSGYYSLYNGRPCIPTWKMVGLILLKNIYDLSDEIVVARGGWRTCTCSTSLGDSDSETSFNQSRGLHYVPEACRIRAGERLSEIRSPNDAEPPAMHFARCG